MENNQNTENEKKKSLPKWMIYSISAIVVILALSFVLFYIFGDEMEIKNGEKLFSVSVGTTYTTQQIGDSLLGETTSELFVVVPFNIKNNSNEEITLYSNGCKLKIGNSTYEPSTILTGVDNPLYIAEAIGSGVTKQITVVFEIPLSAKDLAKTLEITINRYTQSYPI